MNSLKQLTDSSLLDETQRRVVAERSATLAVLHCLREIEARQLYAKENCTSLFEFCMKRFGCTEAAALRRIDAMRLLNDVPELEKKVEAGELNLTQLAQVKGFLRIEKKDAGKTYTPAQTLALLDQLKGCSSRETERKLLSASPAFQARRETQERIKPVTDTLTEIRIAADPELVQLLEEARSLFAHGADMHPSAASLFKKGLQVLVAQRKKQKGIPEQTNVTSPMAPEKQRVPEPTSAQPPSPPLSRYSPTPIRRDIFRRAQGRCEFIASHGLRCRSIHALEIHHRDPYALGGEHSLANLALYCRTHNAFQGRVDFPERKRAS
jgi:hypothetical protein